MGHFGKPSRAHPVQLAIIRQPPLARTNLDKSDASYKLTFGFSGLAYHLEVSILGGSPRLKRGGVYIFYSPNQVSLKHALLRPAWYQPTKSIGARSGGCGDAAHGGC